MRSNLYYKPCKTCTQPKSSNKIWLHSKRDSKLTDKGSEEYEQLLSNGYFISRAEAIGVVKTDETKGSQKDAFDISSLSDDELVELGKKLGLSKAKIMKRETLISRIKDIQDEE